MGLISCEKHVKVVFSNLWNYCERAVKAHFFTAFLQGFHMFEDIIFTVLWNYNPVKWAPFHRVTDMWNTCETLLDKMLVTMWNTCEFLTETCEIHVKNPLDRMLVTMWNTCEFLTVTCEIHVKLVPFCRQNAGNYNHVKSMWNLSCHACARAVIT